MRQFCQILLLFLLEMYVKPILTECFVNLTWQKGEPKKRRFVPMLYYHQRFHRIKD